ncbi:MAG TPA: SDR family NAD(P)-dependent oxidoreductase, partial [Streptosporangiaceae bacterium]|nr:SDR family NAD(P)-dependent oxidoreductase [Streptosporangiaceae bacterium]
MTALARAADTLLEASVIGSFSRIGISARSRLLPEFSASNEVGGGGVALVTGATSGLGLVAASQLASCGWTVHFLARNPDRAARAERTIAAAARGGAQVSHGIADLENTDSVRAFAREFRGTHNRLDVLIHNAGAIHERFAVNQAGIELTVAGQVVAPFVLTWQLLPALRAAAPARVITVSSGGMYTQRLDLTTLQMPQASYRGVTAYARAKRAQVALSQEWARRVSPADIAFHAMHPGWVATPGITAALPRFSRIMRPVLRSPDQGADTIVWLATANPLLLGSGLFWHDRRPRTT